MSLFLITGVTLAGVALGSRVVGAAAKNFSARGGGAATKSFLSMWKRTPGGASQGLRNYYKGGFETEMTRAEAALILGIRQSASREKIRLAHRRVMLANHPDNGGSDYMASKINEAKDTLLKDLGDL